MLDTKRINMPGSDDEAVGHGARHLAAALGSGVGAPVRTQMKCTGLSSDLPVAHF